MIDIDGGEATPATDAAHLARGVQAFDWHPDGRRLVVLAETRGPRTSSASVPPASRPRA